VDGHEEEISEFLGPALRTKLRRDIVQRNLESATESTTDLSESDWEPDLPGDGRDPEEIIVRRYITLNKFFSLLDTGLWFSRIDNFADPFEGIVSGETLRRRWDTWHYSEAEGDPLPYDWNDYGRAKDKIIRKQSFASCWRWGGNESDVFWSAYIGDDPGLAIETSLENLISVIEGVDRDVVIGKVNYRDYRGRRDKLGDDQEDLPSDHHLLRVFHKRKGFQDEQELRLVTREQVEDIEYDCNEGKNFSITVSAKPGLNVEVNPLDLIDRIILSPETSGWVIDTLTERLNMEGLDVDLLRSYLDIDPYKIPPERVESFMDSTRNDLIDTDLEDYRRIDYYEG
jgi:hypothetical protein